LKRKNAFGGIDATTFEEQQEINTQAVDLIRRIRWRVDQELTRRNVEPLFPNNYAGKYDKDEFLIDCDLEFYKVKKLLEKNPNVLKEDPILGIDYLKIIGLIRQRKLLENTANAFDAENSYASTWHDPNTLERENLLKQKREMERFNRQQLMEGSMASQGQESDRLATEAGDDKADEDEVKKSKKESAKDQFKIIQQFDKLATSFEKTGTVNQDEAATSVKIGNKTKLVKETAGMLKKKEKTANRKEKTMRAKLRLKEKKAK